MDYPTAAELKAIKNWDTSTPEKLMELLNYVNLLWMYGDCGYFELKGKNVLRLRLSTAGWSGNESLIAALEKNLFWFCFWLKSERGGHHFFKVDIKTFYPKKEEKKG